MPTSTKPTTATGNNGLQKSPLTTVSGLSFLVVLKSDKNGQNGQQAHQCIDTQTDHQQILTALGTLPAAQIGQGMLVINEIHHDRHCGYEEGNDGTGNGGLLQENQKLVDHTVFGRNGIGCSLQNVGPDHGFERIAEITPGRNHHILDHEAGKTDGFQDQVQIDIFGADGHCQHDIGSYENRPVSKCVHGAGESGEGYQRYENRFEGGIFGIAVPEITPHHKTGVNDHKEVDNVTHGAGAHGLQETLSCHDLSAGNGGDACRAQKSGEPERKAGHEPGNGHHDAAFGDGEDPLAADQQQRQEDEQREKLKAEGDTEPEYKTLVLFLDEGLNAQQLENDGKNIVLRVDEDDRHHQRRAGVEIQQQLAGFLGHAEGSEHPVEDPDGDHHTCHQHQLGIDQAGHIVHDINLEESLQQVQRQIPNSKDDIDKDVVSASVNIRVVIVSGAYDVQIIEFQNITGEQIVPEIDAVADSHKDIVVYMRYQQKQHQKGGGDVQCPFKFLRFYHKTPRQLGISDNFSTNNNGKQGKSSKQHRYMTTAAAFLAKKEKACGRRVFLLAS